MKTSFERHRESAGELGAAEANLAAARELVAEAEKSHKEASARYEEILREGRTEVTPDLVMQAYGEYLDLLKQEAADALRANNFEKLRGLTETMERTQKAYEGDARLMPADLQSTVEELLTNHGIKAQPDQRHYLNRARRFYGESVPIDRIAEVLKTEMEAPNPTVMLRSNDWRGPRHPHAQQ